MQPRQPNAPAGLTENDELVFADIALSGVPEESLTKDEHLSEAEPEVTERVNTVKLMVRDEYAETEVIYTASN